MRKPEESDVERALMVFVLDPKLRALVAEHDPKALAQALKALGYRPMSTTATSTNVARVRMPRFADVLVLSPDAPSWFRDELRRVVERSMDDWIRRYGDVLTLTPAEYEAFQGGHEPYRGGLNPLRCPKCGGPPLADDGKCLVLCESCDAWYDVRTGQACEAPK